MSPAGRAGGLSARGPGEAFWLSWQDVVLGDSDCLPRSRSLSDRGMLIAWASDQTLPQRQATLLSTLEAQTSIRGEENPRKGH